MLYKRVDRTHSVWLARWDACGRPWTGRCIARMSDLHSLSRLTHHRGDKFGVRLDWVICSWVLAFTASESCGHTLHRSHSHPWCNGSLYTTALRTCSLRLQSRWWSQCRSADSQDFGIMAYAGENLKTNSLSTIALVISKLPPAGPNGELILVTDTIAKIVQSYLKFC